MITVSATSIDEITSVVRKLRHQYAPTTNIHINQDTLKYEVTLESNKMNPIVKNLVDKLVDLAPQFEEEQEIDLARFQEILKECEPRMVFAKQLQKIFSEMDGASKQIVVSYVSDQLDELNTETPLAS